MAALLLACAAFYLYACAAAPSRPRSRFAKKQCLDCHTAFADKYLAMKDVHAPVQEKKCEDCHLRHGVIPKLLLKSQGN